MSSVSDDWITPQEAADYMNISVYMVNEYLRRGVENGGLAGGKIGRLWRTKREFCDVFVMNGGF